MGGETESKLSHVWLQVFSYTDEPSIMMLKLQGLASMSTGNAEEQDYILEHRLRVDLLAINLLDDRARLQLWAEDKVENTANWGPFTLDVPAASAFLAAEVSERRRLTLIDTGNGTLSLPDIWT